MTPPTVLVIGATGGLGAEIARTYADRGAVVVLAGRSADALAAVAHAVHASAYQVVDVSNADQVQALGQALSRAHAPFDIVINAAGTDVRKAFLDHTSAEIDRLIAVNLRGAIEITRAFLPTMIERKRGVIAHLGGFADGRLALPYYAVDAATRAGVRAFLESTQREIEGSGVTLTYFCPAPADTDAERPYHALWRSMGTRIVSPTAVAKALVRAVERREQVHVMGAGTRLLAAINAIAPHTADALILRRYARLLAQRFGA